MASRATRLNLGPLDATTTIHAIPRETSGASTVLDGRIDPDHARSHLDRGGWIRCSSPARHYLGATMETRLVDGFWVGEWFVSIRFWRSRAHIPRSNQASGALRRPHSPRVQV